MMMASKRATSRATARGEAPGASSVRPCSGGGGSHSSPQSSRSPDAEELHIAISRPPREQLQLPQSTEHEDNARPASQADTTKDDEDRGPNVGSAEALLSLMQSVDAVIRAERQRDERKRPPEPTSDQGSDDKRRKSTHTLRKEEKHALMDEIHRLETQLAYLRGQAFLPTTSTGDVQQVPPAVSNAVIREVIQEQQRQYAGARSMMTSFLVDNLAAPTHPFIHLTSDDSERRETLRRMKPLLLRTARLYLTERCKFLDLTQPHATSERFVSATRDLCCLRFYVEQFPAEFTVRQVYDATAYYTSNLEISLLDSAGHISIREDDDTGDPSLCQHRLVTTVAGGVVVDSNIVQFAHYDAEADVGVLAATYVDQDDLYPYRSLERLRQNITAFVLITRESGLVVIRRWGHVRMIRHPILAVPPVAMQIIGEKLGDWGDTMIHFLRERLGIPFPQVPPRRYIPLDRPPAGPQPDHDDNHDGRC